jgi:putative flippase GtrA
MARLQRLLTAMPLGRLWRFTVVGAVAAGVQLALLWVLVERGGLNYLVAAVVAIECTIVFQYVLNNAWTFRAYRNAGVGNYLRGLVKTNVVRGSAIPIQVGLLFVFVEWLLVAYLPANALAIVISGLYRYTLDARWTWRI